MTAELQPHADSRPRESRWTVATCALIGLGVGLLFFVVRPASYQADAQVTVSSPSGDLADEVDFIQSESVLTAAQSTLGFAPNISVATAPAAQLVIITATEDSGAKAADSANTVSAIYMLTRSETATILSTPAVAPDSPIGVGPLVYAVVGTLLGALGGLGVSALQMNSRKEADADGRSSDLAVDDIGRIDLNGPSEAPERAMAADYRSMSARQYDVMITDSRSASGGVEPTTSTNTGGGAFSSLVSPTSGSAPADVEVKGFSTAESSEALRAAVAQRALTEAPTSEPDDTDARPAPPRQPVHVHPVAPDPLTSDHETNSDMTEAPTTEPASVQNVVPQGGSIFSTMTAPAAADLAAHQLRAAKSQIESERYQLTLAHQEAIARLQAQHEREVAKFRGEVSRLDKELRVEIARQRSRAGTDQNRVGDLEAQLAALEAELAGLRQQLEAERIDHTTRVTEERGASDRALDNARREFREELTKHAKVHRATLAEHRAELDKTLADHRSRHATEIENAHNEYERLVEAERRRAETTIESAAARHKHDADEAAKAAQLVLERQTSQYREAIAALRASTEQIEAKAQQFQKENRLLQAELAAAKKQIEHDAETLATSRNRQQEEMATLRKDLDNERERSAALRADVLRRSAEAHQVIDRAVEERTAQLAELEASVARQREYADSRVREVSAAAEEQTREASSREATLRATVSRLRRELHELKTAASRS